MADHPDANGSGAGVVIIGGGFGGLYTALALARRPRHPPILLIEPKCRFVFLPLLYELLSGELPNWQVAPRYEELLGGTGVSWLRDRVERIDAGRQLVHTTGGRALPYSRLVLATGSHSHGFGLPGVQEHGLSFHSLEDVERLRGLIRQLRQQPRPLQRLAVVGGGPTGVELACKLGDLLRGAAGVELIEQGPRILPQARAFNREQAEQALLQRDVRLRTATAVTEVDADRLLLLHGGAEQTLAVVATIWTAGQAIAALPIDPEPARDPLGRLRCRADLGVAGCPDLFALGDAALLPEPPEGGASPPATAQVAFQQAELLARNLLQSLAGEPLEPFVWSDLGEMLSLGIGEASLTSGGFTLAGPAAFQLRRLAYLARLPGRAHRLRVAAGWLAGSPAEALP